MRIFGFAFLIAVFLANTVIVSAWAKPCLNGGVIGSPAQSQSMMEHGDMSMSSMPCEDMQKTQNQNDTQHCDGVCLCLHASMHQSITLNNPLLLSMPTLVSLKHDFIDDQFSGISTSTLKRPPRA
jgi:hypothetical protein